jgi:hypothetical protein
MDSPASRYMLDRSGFADTDPYEVETTHTNWEGLFTALAISAIGWITLAVLIRWLV